MEERTRAYLRGRFRDHYRRTDPTPPPDPEAREWGYIPWTSGPTTMVRHQSLLELGEVSDFLQRERPRHVYFSAGRYDDPGADDMDSKGWRNSDLVFDLDADHLPGVDPEGDSYAEMLADCKDELRKLLSFLEDDFGFEDLTVVFSGGRGYHVHVRDEGVLHLDRDERREIVDYVLGSGVELDQLADSELVDGMGLKNPVEKRRLQTDGGWGARAHRRAMAFVDELLAMDEEDALERLQEFEGFGPKKSATMLGAARDRYEALENGNLEVGGSAGRDVFERFLTVALEAEAAAIDEPVTTDTHRLIRLPGSLHGGTALEVCHVARDELDDFDPLVDAVPETFVGHDVTVEVSEPGVVELNDETFTVPEGDVSVPEYVAAFLMARGRAEKGRE
ncbi:MULTISPECIES: DNA primase small subunit PriS [Halorussus]|uniref:DNA primase small subunit PriS n=1 Tax=Halorussus TaxID=1070314 RepID=UPI0020A15615|nr:DNA primase small subunit PriS [Halorussus vallis]USZ76879.1 DNA primase small subunit PriS [Halorussus vallis]